VTWGAVWIWHQLTYREVGEALGIAPQTVANQISRAVTDLRTALAPHLEQVAPEHMPFPRVRTS